MFRKLVSSVKFWLFASVAVPVAAYWRWFFTFDIFTWGDWGYHNPEFVRQLFMYPQAWHREFLGLVDIGISQYLTTRLFYSIIAFILPPQGYDRIVFFFPCILIAAAGTYFLVYLHTKNAFAGFVGSLVYAFNTYILLLNTGHLTLSTAYSLAPVVFILYRSAILKRSLKFALASGIAGFICSGYEPRGFFLIAAILLFYLFYIVFLSGEVKTSLRGKILYLLIGSIPFIIVALTNAYWLLEFTQVSNSYQGVVINSQVAGGLDNVFPRTPLLFSPWWTGTAKMAWGQIQTIPLYFWVVPLIALIGFWKRRANPDTFFWAFITLLGIFLVKSEGHPFGDIYPWLYAHFPGFNAFRDSSKFNIYICLGYSVLIGDFIAWLWSKKLFSRGQQALATGLVVAIFMFNSIPLFLGQVGQLQIPRHMPTDYVTLNNFIKTQPPYFRTLYLPATSKWVYRDVARPMLSMSNLVSPQGSFLGEWSQLNDYTKTGLDFSPFDNLTGIFTKPFAHDLLSTWSIKYVVVAMEDIANNDVFLFPGNTSNRGFVQFLDNIPYLRRINIGTKEIAIYENSPVWPHFQFEHPLNFTAQCPNSTTCHLNLISGSPVNTLYFSENFHSGWQLHIGEFHWWQPLFEKNYFTNTHFETFYGANAYHLNNVAPNTQLTLYFTPQTMLNVGSLIAATTLLFTLFGLFYLWRARN